MEHAGRQDGVGPGVHRWREVLNTDAAPYGGSNRGNAGGVDAHPGESHGFPHFAHVTLPPLATVWLVHDGAA